MEIWKDIEGYEGLYKVSNKGRVYSHGVEFIKEDGRRHYVKGAMLKLNESHYGYMVVKLYKDNKGKDFRVHRLVALAFIENDDAENKTIVNHLNGVKKDNHVENLRWSTYSENNKHAYEMGLKPKPNANINGNHQGEKHSQSKLNDEKVRYIRKNARTNGGIYSNGQLAKEFNVSTSVIWNVVNKKAWKHVK